jgi:hypothetical protein
MESVILGREDKLYYSAEAAEAVQELERLKVVKGKVDAYQLGFAIGVRANEKVEIDSKVNFGNTYSLHDEWVMKSVIYRLYPERSPKERKDLMDRHAEAGIRILYNYVIAHNGTIDWEEFLETLGPAPSER